MSVHSAARAESEAKSAHATVARTADVNALPVDDYFSALAAGDDAEALAVVRRLRSDGVPPGDVVRSVVAPSQRRVGLLWQRGEWSIAQEHVATAISERVLAVLESEITSGSGGRVVVAGVESEWHAIAVRMVGCLLRDRGWRVTLAGASAPADDLVGFLADGGDDQPTGVALHISTAVRIPALAEAIDAFHARGHPVLVGGPGTGPDGRIAELVGADGWAETVDDAHERLLAWASRRPTLRAPRIEPDARTAADDLRANRSTLVAEAIERLAFSWPELETFSRGRQAFFADDLGDVVDHLAAAVLTGSAEGFRDFVGWRHDVLVARRTPPAVATMGLQSVRWSLGSRVPAAAAILDRAVEV